MEDLGPPLAPQDRRRFHRVFPGVAAPVLDDQAGGFDAVLLMEGAVERVRPKMMTVTAIMGCLMPIMWSTGSGSEVMQRIAVPMIGGMVSSTVLTLLVIPAIYALVKQREVRRLDVLARLDRRSIDPAGDEKGYVGVSSGPE